MPDPITTGPPSATGFGPREASDETRQAQHGLVNDAPVDVNCNSVLAREQAATNVLMGKNFVAEATRFNALMSHAAAKIANS